MWWIILKWENTDNPRGENEELLDSMWLGAFEGVSQEFLQQIAGKPDWNSIRKCKWDNIAPLWIAKMPWQEIRTISALLHFAKAEMHKHQEEMQCCDPTLRTAEGTTKRSRNHHKEIQESWILRTKFAWIYDLPRVLLEPFVHQSSAIKSSKEQLVCEQTHLSGMVHQRSSASH